MKKKYFTKEERRVAKNEQARINYKRHRELNGLFSRTKMTNEEKRLNINKNAETRRRKKGILPKITFKKYFTEEEKREGNRKKSEKYRRKKGIFPRKKYTPEEQKQARKISFKKYHLKNIEKRKENTKKWKTNNPNKVREERKQWKAKNPNYYNDYFNINYSENIEFKLTHRLRSRLWSAIKGNYKSGSAIKDLGCSIPELKIYLGLKFQEGMTWGNYGKYGWHIDHIIPLDSFDLSNREEFLKACHYTNLQPLWAEENLKKKNKIIQGV